MDRMSGAHISHPYGNRPRGYVPATEGPRDPQARLEYMLQRLQEAHHTDHADPWGDIQPGDPSFFGVLSPFAPYDPATYDESQRASDQNLALKRYSRIQDPTPYRRP